MIQLNNDFERQAWVQFAAAFDSGEMGPEQEAEYAGRYADAKVLELRQRIVQEKDTDGWEYAKTLATIITSLQTTLKHHTGPIPITDMIDNCDYALKFWSTRPEGI